MTNQSSTLSIVFKSSIALLALFAALGAAVFFTNGASAQTADGDAPTGEQRQGRRGDRTPLTAEQLAEAVANGDITQERADEIAARMELKALAQEIFDADATNAAIADALGVTVEELAAAKEDGTMRDLVEAAGLTHEDIHAIVEAEKAAQLAAAVADGTITQEQADALAEGKSGHGKGGSQRGPRGEGGRGEGRPARGGQGAPADVNA